ncbi:MAG TPA: J domain-containing protein [Acidimicrobiales bacterium]|nr:J domain-containing protein [Acidimicrobiales bacterium]
MMERHRSPVDDPYGILGVDPTCTTEQVRAAYRAAVRSLHPDHRNGTEPDHVHFTALVDAWRVLGDANARAEFDAARVAQPRPAVSVAAEDEPVKAWEPPVELLDNRASRWIRCMFFISIMIVAASMAVLFTIGMSQSVRY